MRPAEKMIRTGAVWKTMKQIYKAYRLLEYKEINKREKQGFKRSVGA